MTFSFTSFDSTIFTFKIGLGAKEFLVHGDALARLSDPLNSAINGDYKEKSDRIVVWDHVKPRTFAKLCEFAYHGGYTFSKPSFEVLEAGGLLVSSAADTNKRSNQGQKREESAWSTYEEEGYVPKESPGNASVAIDQSEEDAEDNSDCAGDFEGRGLKLDGTEPIMYNLVDVGEPFGQFVFGPSREFSSAKEELFGHIELYLLAAEKLIVDLQKVCRDNICALLANLKVDSASLVDFIATARHIYESTTESDNLRHLITEYAAWRIMNESMGGRKLFLDWLDENTDFTRAFWKIVFWRGLHTFPHGW